jgi:hypothetical protein
MTAANSTAWVGLVGIRDEHSAGVCSAAPVAAGAVNPPANATTSVAAPTLVATRLNNALMERPPIEKTVVL